MIRAGPAAGVFLLQRMHRGTVLEIAVADYVCLITFPYR